jgi:diguanylate cyclase (GGDEF)-like protein/PAS domain S-box-containing protein
MQATPAPVAGRAPGAEFWHRFCIKAGMNESCAPLTSTAARPPATVRRLARAFEHSAAGMALLSVDGHWLAVNRAFCELLGYGRDELLGRSFVELTHADDVSASLAQFRRLTTGRISNFGFDKRYLHRDGTPVWVHLDVSMVEDADGRPDFIITQARDITASRRVKQQLADREARLSSVIRSMGEGVVVVDADGGISLANQRAQEILGFDDDMLRWASVREFAARCRQADGTPWEPDRFAISWTLASGRPQREVPMRLDRDGEEAWIELSTEPVTDPGGDGLLGVVATFSDITERVRTEQALKQSEERLSLALEGAKLGMWDWNLARQIMSFNSIAERMLGYGRGEVASRVDSVRALAHPDDEHRLVDEMEAHLRGDKPAFDVDVRMRRKDGGYVWTNIRGRVSERDALGKAVRVTGMLVDISERKQLEQKLEQMARTDELTGLCNRRRGNQVLQREIDRARRSAEPFSLILLDIDHFKHVNDRFGHEAGDRILVEVAELLRARIRRTDVAARWGGEEFALILPGTDRAAGREVAEELLARMADIRTPDGRGISASFGVVDYRQDDSVSGMVRRADRLMYRAKHAGRARVELERGRGGGS